MAQMYARLREGGIVTYSRFMLNAPRKPRETLRLANLAREALGRSGVAEPWRQIAVLQAAGWGSTMIRKGPFTEAETAALRRFAAEELFLGLVHDPTRPDGGPYESGEPFFLGYLGASFFPPQSGYRPPPEVARTLREALAAAGRGDGARSDALLDEVAPRIALDGFGPGELRAALGRNRDKLAAALTAGTTQFRETQGLYERLLRGGEAERAALVAGYRYDLAPTTDDKPFFFDYFRFADFLRYPRDVPWVEAQDEFPVGHMVLASSLLQIVVLGLALILAPLVLLRRKGLPGRGKLRAFGYFAALGVGYMLVEISLMQRFILFLGHPTYSLSVVLAGMLAFSGLGALASARLGLPTRRQLYRLAAAAAALVLLDAALLPPLLDAAIGLGLGGRVVLALALLAPTAFVLGFPFPLGVRLLERDAPVLIPWGWAVNGMLSVAASLLAVALAMAAGFSAVLLAAAAVYALGLPLAPGAARAAAP
jgi:hypothetical protein